MTPQRPGSSPVRRRARLAGALLAAAVLAGCTTARSDLGTSVSSCFRALPTATRAVDGHGHLLGVQKFTVAALQRQAPDLSRQLVITRAASKRICIVAFSGNFLAASVTHPYGLTTGRLAVVVSTWPGTHVLGTVIYPQPPLRIGRSVAG